MTLDTDTYPCVVVEENVTWILFNTTFLEKMDRKRQIEFLTEATDKNYFISLLQIDVVVHNENSTTIEFDWTKMTQSVQVNGNTVTIDEKAWLTGKSAQIN